MSAGGPTIESMPAPPSNVIAPRDAAVASSVNVSAPSPPAIATVVVSVIGRVVATPSTVTTTSVAVAASEMVWVPPAGAATDQVVPVAGVVAGGVVGGVVGVTVVPGVVAPGSAGVVGVVVAGATVGVVSTGVAAAAAAAAAAALAEAPLAVASAPAASAVGAVVSEVVEESAGGGDSLASSGVAATSGVVDSVALAS